MLLLLMPESHSAASGDAAYNCRPCNPRHGEQAVVKSRIAAITGETFLVHVHTLQISAKALMNAEQEENGDQPEACDQT
jgi:hypothetical protein